VICFQKKPPEDKIYLSFQGAVLQPVMQCEKKEIFLRKTK
jgi:hypothetical protein